MSISSHKSIFSAPSSIDGKKALIGLTINEIESALLDLNIPKFRAKQLYHWIYQRGAKSFEDINNISKADKEILNQHFSFQRPEIKVDQKSIDGTQKWLLSMPDGQLIETVFIPEETRGALCVSSQVGCTLTCKFCHTGTQKLVRNLGVDEILAQIMHTRDSLDEWPSSSPKKRLFTNIVMMGMGEPLYNYENVAKALKIAMDGDGLSISRRRITLSTSGVVPEIYKCGEELGVNLAISLHATNDELRSKIMPINNKYPLKELIQACKDYPAASSSRKITFEYVMLKGINDSDEDAKKLATLLKDVHAKINLIPFNPWPGSDFECSSNNRIHKFSSILDNLGFEAPIRKTRGQDILAACGQLKSASERAKKRIGSNKENSKQKETQSG